jgi:voltage-gated potassium channel
VKNNTYFLYNFIIKMFTSLLKIITNHLKIILLVIIFFIYSIINFKLGSSGLLNNKQQNFTFIDSMYYTIVTITSIGYGDITPKTQTAKIIFIFEVILFWLFMYYIFSS